MKQKRGSIISDYLIWWLIAFGILILIGGGYLIITGKLQGMGEYFKNLVRFGR